MFFFYLKIKYRLSSLYSPLVSVTSYQRRGRWMLLAENRLVKKLWVKKLLNFVFQNVHPLNNCLTSSDKQMVRGLRRMSGRVVVPSKIRDLFLWQFSKMSFSVVMLKLCLATLQALLKDYRLKFFELSSEINGG